MVPIVAGMPSLVHCPTQRLATVRVDPVSHIAVAYLVMDPNLDQMDGMGGEDAADLVLDVDQCVDQDVMQVRSCLDVAGPMHAMAAVAGAAVVDHPAHPLHAYVAYRAPYYHTVVEVVPAAVAVDVVGHVASGKMDGAVVVAAADAAVAVVAHWVAPVPYVVPVFDSVR